MNKATAVQFATQFFASDSLNKLTESAVNYLHNGRRMLLNSGNINASVAKMLTVEYIEENLLPQMNQNLYTVIVNRLKSAYSQDELLEYLIMEDLYSNSFNCFFRVDREEFKNNIDKYLVMRFLFNYIIVREKLNV